MLSVHLMVRGARDGCSAFPPAGGSGPSGADGTATFVETALLGTRPQMIVGTTAACLLSLPIGFRLGLAGRLFDDIWREVGRKRA